jgi:hypothetical protein
MNQRYLEPLKIGKISTVNKASQHCPLRRMGCLHSARFVFRCALSTQNVLHASCRCWRRLCFRAGWKLNADMEILAPEIHVLELDGFLNALRCVIGLPSRKFGAGLIAKNGRTIDDIVQDSIYKINQSGKVVKNSVVDFTFIQSILSDRIYSKLPNSNSEAVKNTDWNLIEYYGLISTAEDESGPWNRLISQNSIFLEFNTEDSYDSVVFFVEHNEFVVSTYL